MADVFISYSKSRSAIASELAKELADLGYDVWWDISLLPTGAFGAAIDRELDAATAVIVIWSSESARSKWVYAEASHAERQDKLVNCHTNEITRPDAQIPKPFGTTHSVHVDDIRAIVGALDKLRVARSATVVNTISETPPTPAQAVHTADNRLFKEVETTGTLEAYEFYLNEFPDGEHAPLARFRLQSLRAQAEREAAEKDRLAREAAEKKRLERESAEK